MVESFNHAFENSILSIPQSDNLSNPKKEKELEAFKKLETGLTFECRL